MDREFVDFLLAHIDLAIHQGLGALDSEFFSLEQMDDDEYLLDYARVAGLSGLEKAVKARMKYRKLLEN